MEQKFSMKAFIKKLKNDKLIRSLGMPMGYMPGLPILHSRKDETCITIPFFLRRVSRKKVKETGVQYLVTETYPIRYSVTYALREINLPDFDPAKPSSIVLTPDKEFTENNITEGKLIAFSDLTYCGGYEKITDGSGNPISANRPICTFRVNKEEYEAALEELYSIYDKAINTRLYAKKIDGTVENRLVNKIIAILANENELRPFYGLLDEGIFAAKIVGVDSSGQGR